MSEHQVSAADAMGDGFIFQFEGRTHQFAPKDNVEVVGSYECYLEEQAWRALERAARHLSPKDYQDQADGIRRDVVSGVFGYGSRYWVESVRNMGHQKRLAVLMAQFHDKQFDPAIIDRVYKDAVKVRELVAKMFDIDPNALTPHPPRDAA